MPHPDEKSSRVTIQLGASPSANSHSIKKRSRPTHTKRHRAHALEEESASDSDENQDEPVRNELITTYGSEASDQGDSERDRRRHGGHQSKRHKHDEDRKGERPHGQDAPANGDTESAADTQEKPIKWGLTINMKGSSTRKDQRESRPRHDRPRSDKEEITGNGTHERSIDDEALDALIGTESRKKSKRELREPNDPDGGPRPEDYRAVPIDDFGATLLRSFGWDGQMRGKVKEVTKHANLTGLGAKDAKGAEDLGSWNQKTTKDSRPVRLEDYQREQNKKRQRLEDRHRDSYKGERERERERDRGHQRDR